MCVEICLSVFVYPELRYSKPKQSFFSTFLTRPLGSMLAGVLWSRVVLWRNEVDQDAKH